ncbi:MAG: fibronectin type III domain-containing protein [Vicinamibacterales bacterium]
MSRPLVRAALPLVLATAVLALACGKKGPPLPPLVLLPNPPEGFAAVRQGDEVALSFTVPGANTDRSTPADLARIEVYAWTTPGPVGAEEVVRQGERIGTLAVNKAPDPDEPEPETPAPKGPGLDQNEAARVTDTIDPAVPGTYRSYVAVGFNSRGRRGALTPRVAVPLVDPPAAPGAPRVTYDEKAITVAWAPVTAAEGTAVAYAVYRPGTPPVALTEAPVAEPSFADAAIAWGEERCYEVRSVLTVESVRIESAASAPQCVTPRDTFAPAPPQGLVGVGSENSVSLIWTANDEADIAGYIVLRAMAPATELVPATPAPIPDTNYRDPAPTGARVTYAVVAVDKAGNRSAPSTSITETAR